MVKRYLTAIVIHFLKSLAKEEGYRVLQGFPDSSEFSMYVLISMTTNYNTLEMGGAHNADLLGQQVAPTAMYFEAICVFIS